MSTQKRKQPPPVAVAAADGGGAVGFQRLFHARTRARMTEREVAAILADPRGAPDNDDEDDLAAWKARAARSVMPALPPQPAPGARVVKRAASAVFVRCMCADGSVGRRCLSSAIAGALGLREHVCLYRELRSQKVPSPLRPGHRPGRAAAVCGVRGAAFACAGAEQAPGGGGGRGPGRRGAGADVELEHPHAQAPHPRQLAGARPSGSSDPLEPRRVAQAPAPRVQVQDAYA